MDTQSVSVGALATASSDTAQAQVGARGNVKGSAQATPAAQKTPQSTVDTNSGDARDPRSLQFQVDGSSRQIVATIVDESNKMVIVQIPDAEVLRIAKAIDRMQGFLIDHKV